MLLELTGRKIKVTFVKEGLFYSEPEVAHVDCTAMEVGQKKLAVRMEEIDSLLATD